MALTRGRFNMVQSWGVASARHTSGTLVYRNYENPDMGTEHLFDVPLGPSIVRWDISSGERCKTFQAHEDVVTCTRWSPDHRWLATSCYGGQVKLWDEQWTCVDGMEAPMGCQHHLAWSHDSKRFMVVGNGPNSSVVVYNLITSTNDGGSPTTKLQLAWQVKAGDTESEQVKMDSSSQDNSSQAQTKNPSEQLAADKPEAAVNYHYVDAFYMGEFTPSGTVLAVQERPGRTTIMQLLDSEGKQIKMAAIESENNKSARTLFMSEYRSDCYAIGLQGGQVLFVGEELQVKATINVSVTGRTCLWDGDALVLPTDSGSLIWWSMGGAKVREVKFGSPDIIMRMEWSVSGHSMWVCGFSSLWLLSVKRDHEGGVADVATNHVIHSHEISCSGVGYSPSRWSIAAGDLAGNVWIMEGTKDKETFKCNVGGSVRCVVWRNDDVVLVGSLDGELTECKVGGAYTPIMQMDGSIIQMRFNSKQTVLAIGTSKGMLEVYVCTPEGLKVIAKVIAHPPKNGPQDKRFGQLTKQAEVWSLCWSPTEDMIATCSEDQTTKVWDTSDWKCLTTLTGHSMAVTSVVWKDIGKGTLIATCSDDRTIRLSSGESYELIRVLNTKDIYGWHTLTYLSFHPAKHSSLILCTTQNSHVVVWDAASGERKALGKIHLGSIEGLAWCEVAVADGGCEARAVTVGADCVVSMFTVNT